MGSSPTSGTTTIEHEAMSAMRLSTREAAWRGATIVRIDTAANAVTDTDPLGYTALSAVSSHGALWATVAWRIDPSISADVDG